MVPLVSIIIPTYNREHLIRETLESVNSQTYTNWECIVVDDGSLDNTLELIEFYSEKDNRIKFYQRPMDYPKGANSCRNYGFEVCNGDMIKWLDSDDLLSLNAIEVQVQHLNSNNSIDASLAYGQYFNGEVDGTIKSRPLVLNSEDVVYDFITGNIHFSIVAPLWRKSFLDKQKCLLKNRILKLQDVEFHFRMLMAGLKFEMLDQSLFFYRYSN